MIRDPETKNDALTPAQCAAGVMYLCLMLAVLWVSTGSLALVLTVFVIGVISGGAHVRLSSVSAPIPRKSA